MPTTGTGTGASRLRGDPDRGRPPVTWPELARVRRLRAGAGALWSENRDIPVEGHVAAILDGTSSGLRERVAPETMAALVEAYVRPALLAPPAADPRAREGIEAVRARGISLAVLSNTMRTPGLALRKVLAFHGLLDPFAHLTFSDEVGSASRRPRSST